MRLTERRNAWPERRNAPKVSLDDAALIRLCEQLLQKLARRSRPCRRPAGPQIKSESRHGVKLMSLRVVAAAEEDPAARRGAREIRRDQLIRQLEEAIAPCARQSSGPRRA